MSNSFLSKTIPLPIAESIVESFRGLPDRRAKRGRDHKLIDIMVIAFSSILAGGKGFNDMALFGKCKKDFFSSFLELPHGIPDHDTFNRVFQALDPECFCQCFIEWTQGLREPLEGEVVAMDGKSLRRSLDKNKGQSLPHIVSAWASGSGLVLGQVKVDEKSNEIRAIPQLIESLNLEGCTVTIDAMGCQKKIASDIIKAKAHYCLSLKGNQGRVHEEVKSYMDDIIERHQAGHLSQGEADFLETVEKDHGRMETRRFWHSSNVSWFADLKDWKALSSFGVVESRRNINGVETCERRYYLSSLHQDALSFSKASRQHWGVENNVHWMLDVAFGEDSSRARCGYAAQNLALLRRMALNVLKQEQSKGSMRGKIKKAGWDNAFLLLLLGFTPASQA